MELKNKVVVITGGSDGLGLSITKKLLSKGCKVHVIARDKDKLESLRKYDKSMNLFTHSADITNSKDLSSVGKEINDCDILINCAGIWLEGKVDENKFEEISRAIDVNLKGVIYTTKVFLPFMIKKNDGFIINISSTTGIRGRQNQSVYSAAKFGVQGFTESLKDDLGATNIKVVGFYPGGMSTKMFAKAGNPKENADWMDTDKVAKVIEFIMQLDDTMILDHVVLNKRNTKLSN